MVRTSKKRTIRRRSRPARKVPRLPVSLSNQNTIVKMSKWITSSYGQVGANVTANGDLLKGAAFRLGNLADSSRADIVGRFKLYRLDSVDCYFRLITNPNATGLTNKFNQATVLGVEEQSMNYYPNLWVCPEYTTETDPSDKQVVKDTVGAKMFILKPDTHAKFRVKPQVQMEAYNTITSSGYGPAAKVQWINVDFINVPYYGIRFCVEMPQGGNNQQFQLQLDLKYNFSLKLAM